MKGEERGLDSFLAGQNPHPDTSEVFLAGENERSEKAMFVKLANK